MTAKLKAKTNSIPRKFDEKFLSWFRAGMERSWASAKAPPLAYYKKNNLGGIAWQKGTRFANPLNASQIKTLEKEVGFAFPADYRLFLEHLHATNKARTGASFGENGNLTATKKPGFRDWLTESDAIDEATSSVFEGFIFDIEQSAVWSKRWGKRPTTKKAREKALRAQFAKAPKLIPIFGHRFLLAEPNKIGNPVFSIHQTDIIIYGANLRDCLLREFHQLLGVPAPRVTTWTNDYTKIPFWGEFL